MESFIQAIEGDEDAAVRSDLTWGPGNWVSCLHEGGIVRHHRDLRVDGASGELCPRAVPVPATEPPGTAQPRQAEPR